MTKVIGYQKEVFHLNEALELFVLVKDPNI
jgi:hypothetical protein